MLTRNLPICHRCPLSQSRRWGGCAGPCPCIVDGVDIVEHARSGFCPAGRFPRRGPGGWLSRTLWTAGVARGWYWLMRRTGRTCGCAGRAAALDRFGARLLGFIRKLGWKR